MCTNQTKEKSQDRNSKLQKMSDLSTQKLL